MNLHALAGFAALIVAGLTLVFMIKKQQESDCPS